MKTQCELNDGHIHEAIDRIYVTMNYLQNTLAEHALIDSVEEFEFEIQKAITILAELYQTIGQFESIYELSQRQILRKGYKIRP